jgi:MFS family permease
MEDLSLSRAHIGLLVGFSFVIFYTLVGLVLGVAADRWPRRWLVTGGVALWSAMTAVSGAARGLTGLAGPRVLLGVGEATLTPAALAMLGDAFPQRRLGFATSVYYAGLPLGTALSLWIAGWMAPRFGWRACFWMLGAAGLLMLVPMCVFREPPRRGRETAATPTAAAPVSVGGLVGDLVGALRDRPALGLVMLGGALLAYASAAALHGITWLVQERGFSFARATILSGGMAVGAGCAGNLVGGWFTDWCQRRWAGGRSWSLVLLTVFFAPFSIGFFMLPPASPLFYVCWCFSVASTVAYFGPTFAAIQELAPAHVRSSAVAMGLLVINVLGVGPGPWITGLIGDRWSLTAGLVVSIGVAIAAVVPFTLAARLVPAHRR